METIRRAVPVFSFLLVLSIPAFAQLSTGSMSGTVTDATGAIVAGATVTATQTTTGRSLVTVSTEAGLYSLPNLDVGTYTLSVEKPGFKMLTRSNIVIAISTKSVVDVSLEIGDVSEIVTVTADAPVLQSASTEIGTNFAPRLFRDAPIYAGGLRNPEAFIGLQAGVVNGAGAEGGISGGARRSKEILIDGANATNPESGGVAFNGLPSVEALGEFKLINNTFAAEYGRTGGGLESFVTASGGNQFHGNIFDFHTSSALSANAWANNAAGVRKPAYHGNNYGFALGGPVWVPKLYHGKDRTFFFFALDNFRRTDSSSRFVNVPTVKQRQGDFSELLPRVINDPVTGQPFSGNIIPQTRFSSVSKNILAVVPQPASGSLQQNYLATTTSRNQQDSWSLKINHNFTKKHLFAGYVTKQDLSSLADGPLPSPLLGAGNNAISANRPIFARFNYDWLFTPTLGLHMTYGITKLRQYFDN